MRSGIAIDMEQQGNQCSTDGLSREAGGGEHATGTTGALRRCRGEQHVIVGRLEKAEAHTTQHQPPYESEMRCIDRDERETETAYTHNHQPGASQDSGVYLPD